MAAVGLTVKSGWACAVLLTGTTDAPHVDHTCRVELSDPAIPESRQPYHQGFATERARGPELSRLVASVKRYGRRSVANLIREYERSGHPLRGAGVVVGSFIDPERIANEHIRIHAREGQLFRTVVAEAAARSRLGCTMWRERDLYATAEAVLRRPSSDIRAALASFGDEVEGSWRAEHKGAALAAWLVLSGGTGATRGGRRVR